MQKKYLILPIIFSLFSILFAGAPDTLWTRTYGGPYSDYANAVQQTSDGGFIIAGWTGPIYKDSTDVYLIRTNSNGDTLWTRTYGGTKEDNCNSVQQTSDGGFVAVGYTESFGTGKRDVYLINTNSNGDTLWTKTYGGAELDRGESVQLTNDGGFIIAGHTNAFTPYMSYFYLIRTNSNGDTLWTKTYGETGLETPNSAYSVQQTTDSGFIITGTHDLNVYLIRTNSNGDTLWTKSYGGTGNSACGNSIQQTSDGGFIIAGEIESSSAKKTDIYLIRTNSNGDTLWTRTYGGPDYEWCKSAQQTIDGGFIITGRTRSFGAGSSDIYLIRTNLNGDTIWTKTYGGIKGDASSTVQQTTDGGYIIAGGTASLGDTLGDVYLIRLEPEVGIQDYNPNSFLNYSDLNVSSYQGNISIRYNLPYSTYVKLEAYNIKGKLVKVIANKFMQKGSYCVNLDSKRFGSGLYYIKLSMENNKAVKKFIVAK